ncbi:hypothetical protein [Nitrolancea hollandica]|uniref:Uncharacterized protein n=1 Tax=Nitrolancea hollandica Lb TaxID=1129897 RepID=I4EG23_9BACT|nr:hypothetical protein [Nitrolancea hollandica]CCF83635.1 hypothetical protein NITHO_2520010 [Nitrolancea hollandica Lb]
MLIGRALAITKTFASDRNVANAAIQVMLALAEQGEPRAQAWCKGLHGAVVRRVGDEA